MKTNQKKWISRRGATIFRIKNKSGNYVHKQLTILDAIRTHIAIAARNGPSVITETDQQIEDLDVFEDNSYIKDVAEMNDPAQTAQKKHKLAVAAPVFRDSDVFKLVPALRCILHR